MALYVAKSPAFVPDLSLQYSDYAVVKTEQRKGLRKIFGPRAGSVSVSMSQGSAFPLIQVVPPSWNKGQEDEWDTLRRCYEQVLHTAAEHNCQALSLPLLTAEDPAFPAYIDFKLAVDTANAFLESHDLDIHLLANRRDAFQMPQLRQDVEHFLSTHFFEDGLPWSPKPFTDPDRRFNTIAPPCPPSPSASAKREPEFASRAKKARGISIPLPELPEIDFSSRRPKKTDLSQLLRTVDAGFSETLLQLIDKSGKKDSEIYNKANVSRQHFSKIRNNPDYKPTKATAIAFAIALELNMDQTRDLIGRAGYALTTSSKFDLIIMYFIQNHNYNMFDINETLYEFDQILLGT